MATSDEGPRTLRVGPRGALPALGRPGGGRAPSQLAYVLHSYDWSESSLIVELFTRAQGRVVTVARGAKKPTSNFRAVLMQFAPLQAVLGKAPADREGEAEILPLRSAEWAGGAALLQAAALPSGFYLNELLLKMLARQDAHPALFDAYADTLATLATEPDDAAALRAFELVLLRELGWLPELSSTTLTSQALEPTARYTLHAEAGVAAHAQGPTGTQWVNLEAALSQNHHAALRAACAPAAAALRGPLRDLLHYHLSGTPLRTRQVWQGVQRLTESR